MNTHYTYMVEGVAAHPGVRKVIGTVAKRDDLFFSYGGHFHNYTGHTAFDTKIFDIEYDYVCESFHDDFALELYQNKEYHQMRII